MGAQVARQEQSVKPVVLPGAKLISISGVLVPRKQIVNIEPYGDGRFCFTTVEGMWGNGTRSIYTTPMTKEETIAFFKAYSGAGSDEEWGHYVSTFFPCPTENKGPALATPK